MDKGPTIQTLSRVLAPSFTEAVDHAIKSGSAADSDSENIHELVEWIGLAVLESPRINSRDCIDSYLSRYEVPEGSRELGALIVLNWNGFYAASWVTELLIACMSVQPLPPSAICLKVRAFG